jgi:branched-chain amino acid transport system ATP-binding protein
MNDPTNGTPLLAVSELAVNRSGAVVLQSVSFNLAAGECLSILGRNGAGKTTLVEAMTGLLAVRDGSVQLFDHALVGMSPRAIARLGVSLVPANRRLFWNMTVQDNLALGDFRSRWLWRGPTESAYEPVFDLFPDLRNLRSRIVRTLSGGQQQMVAVARALMSSPRVLILDEPTAGLSPQVVEAMVERLHGLRRAGLTILLLEQNVDVVLQVSSHVSILHRGRITATADPTAIAALPEFVAGLFSERAPATEEAP